MSWWCISLDNRIEPTLANHSDKGPSEKGTLNVQADVGQPHSPERTEDNRGVISLSSYYPPHL